MSSCGSEVAEGETLPATGLRPLNGSCCSLGEALVGAAHLGQLGLGLGLAGLLVAMTLLKAIDLGKQLADRQQVYPQAVGEGLVSLLFGVMDLAAQGLQAAQHLGAQVLSQRLETAVGMGTATRRHASDSAFLAGTEGDTPTLGKDLRLSSAAENDDQKSSG